MKMKKNKAFLLAAAILSAAALFSEEGSETEKAELDVRIEQMVSDDFPNVKGFVVVKDGRGENVAGLAGGLFSFKIDSQEVAGKLKVTPVSMGDVGVDYSILLSNNGIMDGEALDFQKNAVIKFADMMGESDTLSVYTISEDTGAVMENVARADFDPALVNKIEVSAAQPRLYDTIMALTRKIAQKKAARKILILLSDGRDQNSRFTKDQLEESVNAAGVPVYSVGMRIVQTQTLSFLDEISELTGGAYYYAGQVKNVPDCAKQVIDSVKKSYFMEATIKGMKGDNQTHLFEIKISENEAEGKGSKTFTAVKHPIPKWLIYALIGAAILMILLLILFAILRRRAKRRRMGITKRKCPDCRRRMKDNWDYCPFCRYMPKKAKKEKKEKEKKEK